MLTDYLFEKNNTTDLPLPRVVFASVEKNFFPAGTVSGFWLFLFSSGLLSWVAEFPDRTPALLPA